MKLLIVCESSHFNESGGRVVRFMSKFINKDLCQVKILVLSNQRDDFNIGDFYKLNDVTFLPVNARINKRISNLYFNTKVINDFENILISYSPDIVHFASFDHKKPFKFISLAKKNGAKVILQPWTMHFFCAQGFGFKDSKTCTKCSDGHFFEAYSNKCITNKALPSQLERYYLRKAALNADIFLSSNVDLDIILRNYGVPESKIKRFPVPFDCDFLETSNNTQEDYYIFYGQANPHKGLNVLLNVFKEIANCKLKIFPLANFELVDNPNNNIEVINNVGWNSGLKEAVIKSKAALFPSLWSTSTEYALCEAMLLKKPVVVFNIGVHKSIFKNRFNAMVVEPGDYIGFANAVLELESNLELRNFIGENGYQTVLEINNPVSLNNRLLNIYNS